MKSVTTARSLAKNKKDFNEAESLRHEGKLLFNVGKSFEALEHYNKSLLAAQLNSTDAALAYCARSEVYHEAREYQLCLDNIKMALKSACPADQIDKLRDLEKDCRELMTTHIADPSENPWNFFKLSHPANKKIPFIVDCLELQKSDIFGRLVITTQDLQPGDIIAIEEPFFKAINADCAHTRCANCLKCNKMSLIPSQISHTAMFCSQLCIDEATKTFMTIEGDSKLHDIKQRMLFKALSVCNGSFDELEELMTDPKMGNKTIFDFDLSDPSDPSYKKSLLVCNSSLVKAEKISPEILRYLQHHPILSQLQNERDVAVASKFLLHAFKILTVNSFGIEWVMPTRPADKSKESIHTKIVGDGLCQFGSLLNHSCLPNVDRVFVDNKFVFFVRRPIKSGQQLFTCYGTLFADAPRELRQETLLEEYEFLCSCEACEGDYPPAYSYPWTHVPITIIETSKASDWIEKFRKACRKIVKNQHVYSHIEMCELMLKNLYYLTAIAKSEPFIF